MKGRSKVWILGYMIMVTGTLALVGYLVVKVDPFFHYHKPDTDRYYYTVDNERSQNDGISKNFDYDALITGTSMIKNFKTSEMDMLFGTNSIKLPYSGGTYKEINDNLKQALSSNPNLKIIVRGLDTGYIGKDKDAMRKDLGDYPDYLYDDFWYNDVKYIFNRDVIFGRVYPMIMASGAEGFQPGITSFDEYARWNMEETTFGIKTVCPDGVTVSESAKPLHLSETERETILDSVWQNITSLAEAYPDVTFYYFFTPYSVVWWGRLVNDGSIYKQIESEKLVIEEVLKHQNIKMYSFNTLTDITTDLNHYKDEYHYGPWINSLMIKYMKDGKCLLTDDNYQEYLNEELSFYISYDYSQLNAQADYEDDCYAEELLNQKIDGVESLD